MKQRRKNPGRQWEDHIDAWNGRYLRQGLGVVYRTSPPSIHTRQGIRTIDIGPLDFLGHIGGVPFTADAKATTAKRWPFSGLVKKTKGRDRSAHQARQLDLWMDTGGVCGLLLRLEAPYGPGWFVPWHNLRGGWWAWYRHEARAASIDSIWCDVWGHRLDMHKGYLDAVRQEVA